VKIYIQLKIINSDKNIKEPSQNANKSNIKP
jgi:hypothetical protein